MRILAWVLIVVTAVALLVAGYELATMRLMAGEVQVEVTPAAQNEALFEQLRADMANNALTGRVFTGESIGDIADYVFVTYTVPVRNFNLLRAEWIELAVQPQEGDVTQLFTGDAQQVAGLRSAELRATVLCRLDEQTAAARTPSLSVNYFIFGRAYSFSL